MEKVMTWLHKDWLASKEKEKNIFMDMKAKHKKDNKLILLYWLTPFPALLIFM